VLFPLNRHRPILSPFPADGKRGAPNSKNEEGTQILLFEFFAGGGLVLVLEFEDVGAGLVGA